MPQDALTYKYIPQGSTREYNTFTEEYFSGADVTIYLDGRQMTQVAGLNYSIQEQHKPIYGYSSRTFDDIAIGTRIVVGSFKVPISNPEKNAQLEEFKNAAEDPSDIINPGSDTSGEGVTGDVGLEDFGLRPSWAANTSDYSDLIREEAETESSKPSKKEPSQGEMVAPYEFDTDIKNAQKALVEKGYDVDVNGFNDDKTSKALLKFQKDNEIAENGLLDDLTKKLLLDKDNPDNSANKSGIVKMNRVPFNGGPGEEYRTLMNLRRGAEVTILEKVDGWYFVLLKNDRKGYIKADLLEIIK